MGIHIHQGADAACASNAKKIGRWTGRLICTEKAFMRTDC